MKATINKQQKHGYTLVHVCVNTSIHLEVSYETCRGKDSVGGEEAGSVFITLMLRCHGQCFNVKVSALSAMLP